MHNLKNTIHKGPNLKTKKSDTMYKITTMAIKYSEDIKMPMKMDFRTNESDWTRMLHAPKID